MSLLPTAHAGQSFGARRIDFYTVSGEVSASDDATGRVTDTDSMTHDVRLLDRSNALAPGDTASVLRVQAGPNRRSRPAAIINHSRGTWMRAAPEATTLLARSGVTRGFNWWLSVWVLALVAIASVWPAIHVFLTEVNASLMAPVPAFDVFSEINAFLPALAGWRMESALPAGLLDSLASLGFIPMEQLTEWSLGLGAGLVTLLAFFGRSWRLVYIPALGALALATGAILGSALPTLAVVGGSLAFFMLGGLVNRIRDGGRFNARVARLAEHALRNPPQEGVRSGDTAQSAATGIAASAAIATATAAAHGDNQSDEATETADLDAASGTDATDATDTAASAAQHAPSDAQASGEAEAPDQADLLPAAPSDEASADTAAQVAAPESSGDAAAIEPDAEPHNETDPQTETMTAADKASGPETSAEDTVPDTVPETGDAESMEPVAAAITGSEDAPTEETPTEDASTEDASAPDTTMPEPAATDDVDAAVQDAAPETVANDHDGSRPAESADDTIIAASAPVDEPVESAAETVPDTAIDTDAANPAEPAEPADAIDTPAPVAETGDADLDDDLPSLDDVAAAAALTETESHAVDNPGTAATETASVALDLNDERTMPVAPPPPMPGDGAPQAAAAVETVEPEVSTDAPSDSLGETGPQAAPAPAATPIVDDPMMDETGDPMVTASGSGDFAPGAPDIELDRTPAE